MGLCRCRLLRCEYIKNKHRLRSEDVRDWLRKKGYDVPTSTQPIDLRSTGGGRAHPRWFRQKKIGVYRIFHIETGRSYIGQSVDIYQRIRQHFCRSGKFGPRKSMDWEILEECDKESLTERENHWIKKFKSKKPNGYN